MAGMWGKIFWVYILIFAILVLFLLQNQEDLLVSNTFSKSPSQSNHIGDNNNYPPSEVEKLLFTLHSSLHAFPVTLKRIAIGLNTNLDLVCSAIATFEHLNISQVDINQPHEQISSLEELSSTFGYYFQKGSAAERYYSNQQEFEWMVNEIRRISKSQSNNPLHCQFRPGGNAALMANNLQTRFRSLEILLGGPIGTTLSSLLHPSIHTLPPLRTDDDEVHLILEYSTGEVWNGGVEGKEMIITPRSNRFIISHDIRNSQLSSIEEFEKTVLQFDAEVIIISGSHLLESLEEGKRTLRLNALKTFLSSIPKTTAVHLEVAGVGDLAILKEIVEELFGEVDSIGLNEQELGFIYLALGGTEYTIEEFTKPTLSVVTKSIEFILSLPICLKAKDGLRSLNRIHLHYLTYHMICLRDHIDDRLYQWDRSRAKMAVSAGSIATSMTACGKEEGNALPDPADCQIRPYLIGDQQISSEINVNDLFQHYKYRGLEFWVSPVVVCKKPIRTVGLGDIISSTSLAYSYHNHHHHHHHHHHA